MPAEQHDGLGMSLALRRVRPSTCMQNLWQQPIFEAHRPRKQRQGYDWSSLV
jgi:hypothetical protein